MHIFGLSTILGFITAIALASEDEQRLLGDLFRGYNQLVQPVQNITVRPVQILFSLALVLLINVDERNQIMQTNVWPTMKWVDYQMRWDPKDYGEIRTIRVPPDRVWLPDIVLFNNADGNYEVSFYSNVVVEHTGDMLWVPPAIYKSSCTIDVEYFPFDEQICAMIFGSWTFNKDEVTINHADGKRQVDLNDYSPSGIWDIIDVPGELIHSKSKIAYQIRIRRKALFYTVILIIPTILMAFLSMMVFYLPAEATEKITLAISILLALVVFLLLVSKILPPTSSTIPLMAKYLLLIFVLNIITILVTVIVVKTYFRGLIAHTMPHWVRKVFLRYLPLLLMMERPIYEEAHIDNDILRCCKKKDGKWRKKSTKRYNKRDMDMSATNNRYWIEPGEFVEMSKPKIYRFTYPMQSTSIERETLINQRNGHALNTDHFILPNYVKLRRRGKVPQILEEVSEEHLAEMPEQMIKAIEAIEFISEQIAKEDRDKKILVEWKYVSMVIDRVLLYTFFAITVGGTFGVLLSAPNVFEHINQTEIIERLMKTASDDYFMRPSSN